MLLTAARLWCASSSLPPSQGSLREMSVSGTEIQPMEDVTRQQERARRVRYWTGRFRVLIIGRANAGKTTILQRVCDTTEQPKIFSRKGDEIDFSTLNPSAQRGEHDIENEMIFESNEAFVFHDSCGFEAGRTSEMDKVKDFVQKRSTNKMLKDHLHVIWYCIPINDEARPITRAELNFFAECGTGRVPVIVLFTKADMLDAQTIQHLVDTGMNVEDAVIKAPEESVARFQKQFGHQLYKKKYPPKEHVYFRDMQNSTSDCSELLRKTAATLSDDRILHLFLTVQKNNLSLSIEYGITRAVFPGWKLFKRKREWREIVENVLQYFMHMNNFFNLADVFAQANNNYYVDDDDNNNYNNYNYYNNDYNNRIHVENVLNDIDWPSIGKAKTFRDIAYLCIVTAIIAEHSYFLWKQNPSASSASFKLAIEKLSSSVDLTNIETAIEKASHLKTKDQKHALVKIALENRLSL